MTLGKVLDLGLKRLVVVVALVLLSLLCFFSWRIYRIAVRIEAAGAEAGRAVQAMEGKVDTLVKSIAPAVALGSAVLPGENAPSAENVPRATVDAEVEHLIARIRESGLEFQHDDDVRSGPWTARMLSGKYSLFKDSIPNAESFVARIAGQQLDGDVYYVVENGAKRPLAEWLTEALTQYRAQSQETN